MNIDPRSPNRPPQKRTSRASAPARFAALAAAACVLATQAGPPPSASCGVANVDGLITEWTPSDVFANMYRAAKDTKPIESTVSLRYDVGSETLYVMVLQSSSDIPVLVAPDDAFVKIAELGNGTLVNGNSGDDGTPPDFQWVGRGYDGDNNHARGWEASIHLEQGDWTLNVHTQVYDDGAAQTSAVKDRAIPLRLDCPLTASIGNYVWVDTNADGIQNEVGTGLDGVTVELYLADGTFVSSQDTAGGGFYLFDGLTPDDYYVVVQAPAGYVFTGKDTTADDSADSDANGAGRMATTTLGVGEIDLTWDAGLIAPGAIASITGSVYDDLTAVPDQNKNVPIQGVQIKLYIDTDGDGFPDDYSAPYRVTSTDDKGYYEFLNVPIGPSYVIIEEDLAEYISTYDVFTTPADNRIALTVDNPGVYPLNDFWDYKPGTPGDSANQLGSLVWLDKDNDGTYDAGSETGIDGVSLLLWQVVGGVRQDSDNDPGNGQTPFRGTTTSSGGLYLFSNLPPGDYQVEIPVGNFATGGALAGSNQTSGTPDANDNQEDDDNNGQQPGGAGTAITSPVINLANNTEPTGNGVTGTEFGPGGAQDDATDDDNGDMTVDFGLRPNPPTAARVSDFRAVRTEQGTVRLSWVTLVEADVIGFRLQRQAEDGAWTPLTAGIIRGQGTSFQPRAYVFEDRSQTGTAKYRLVSVDLRGMEQAVAVTEPTVATVLQVVVNEGGVRVALRGRPESEVVLESAADVVGGQWGTEETVRLDSTGVATVNRRLDGTAPVRFFRVRE